MSTKKPARHKHGFLRRHSLSLVSGAILTLVLVLYSRSDPSTHWGSFFGNATADWLGVLMTVIATKYFYEIGSKESRQPRGILPSRLEELIRDHSLSIFLVVTGIGWVIAFARMDAGSKWGQEAGNILSEWTQQLGLVLLTKRLIEQKSKESQ